MAKGKKKKEPSYYEILEVEKEATSEQIRTAYRKLSLRYHPDKNPEGGEKFKEINRAHEVLSDQEKRSVYDRYGAEGVQISEMSSAHFTVSSESLPVRWGKTFGMWFMFIVLDWLFGAPVEWLAILAITIYLVWKLVTNKAEFFLILAVVDLVIYWIVPVNYLAVVPNVLLYAALMAWGNAAKQAWDPTILVWFSLLGIDYWGDRYYNRWYLLGAHTITFSILFLGIMFIFFQTQFIPEALPSYSFKVIKKVFLLAFKSSTGNSSKSIPTMATLLWLLVFGLDYFFNFSFEWLALTVLCALSAWTWPVLMLAGFVTVVSLVHYFIPSYILSVTANVALHLSTIVILRLVTMEIQQEQDMLRENATQSKPKQPKTFMEFVRGMPISYYGIFFLLEYLDFFYRVRPERWSLLATISTVWAIFMGVSLVLSELLKSLEKKLERGRTQAERGESHNQQAHEDNVHTDYQTTM